MENGGQKSKQLAPIFLKNFSQPVKSQPKEKRGRGRPKRKKPVVDDENDLLVDKVVEAKSGANKRAKRQSKAVVEEVVKEVVEEVVVDEDETDIEGEGDGESSKGSDEEVVILPVIEPDEVMIVREVETSDDVLIVNEKQNKEWFNLSEDTEDYVAEDSSQSGEPVEYRLWTEKYKPNNAEDIVGQNEALHEVRCWLKEWNKREKRYDEESDVEEKTRSCLLVCGEPGVGKSSLVHAVAQDLDIMVFEMNCSMKRSGKIVTEQLLEATQSHRLGRFKQQQPAAAPEKTPANNLFNYFFKSGPKSGKNKKKKGGKAKEEEAVSRTSLPTNALSCSSGSLILFDDVDVIFEEDEGFWRSVSTLIGCTKKPIIFTATQFVKQIEARFENMKILKMRSPSKEELTSVLMSIREKEELPEDRELCERLAFDSKGDIRRSINQLQFASQAVDQRMDDSKHGIELTSKPCSSKVLMDVLSGQFSLLATSDCRELLSKGQPIPFEDDTHSRILAYEIRTCIERLSSVSSSDSGSPSSESFGELFSDVGPKLSLSFDSRRCALDYFPYMSEITKTEIARFETVADHSRKNRRFLHYFDAISLFVEPKDKARLATIYDNFNL